MSDLSGTMGSMTTTRDTAITVPSHEPTTAALAPINRQEGSLVRPAAAVDAIEEAFRSYATLCERLLEPTDFQRIGSKDFRKKSAWRKLAVAYGVSSELVSESEVRNDQGRIIRAKVIMRAIAPNGRYQDGIGICDVFEKCCDKATCKNRSQYHDHCAADCRGVIHFSNPEHDLPATAMTRATNRAQSDLFGLGEVSAEEITDKERHQEAAKDWFVENGWDGGADEEKAHLDALVAKLKDYAAKDASFAPKFREWREGEGIDLGKTLTRSQWEACSAKADELVAVQAQDAAAEAPQVPAEPSDGEQATDTPPATDESAETPEANDRLAGYIEQVKAMPIADVDWALAERNAKTGGNEAARRQRLVLALVAETPADAVPAAAQ